MSLLNYSPCTTLLSTRCADSSNRCDLCIVDTETRDEQLQLDSCLRKDQLNAENLVDWALMAPGSEINKTCYNIANKSPNPEIQDTHCYNGGIWDIYTQSCICNTGFVGDQCGQLSVQCIGTTCTTSKNSREVTCDPSICKESLLHSPELKPFTLRDFIILFIILFILSLPLVWIGIIKGLAKKKKKNINRPLSIT